MLNVRSWTVHNTPIPCSLCPNLARLPHYPPALQSPFSFHLGCGYARKKGGQNEKYLVIPVT